MAKSKQRRTSKVEFECLNPKCNKKLTVVLKLGTFQSHDVFCECGLDYSIDSCVSTPFEFSVRQEYEQQLKETKKEITK